jgi:hypothetical protein
MSRDILNDCLTPTTISREQLSSCLSQMEQFLFKEEFDDNITPNRIKRIALQIKNRHRYHIVNWLINNKTPSTAIYQNIVYHMILYLEFPPDVEEHLIAVLLGEDGEFLIPSECIFTEEVTDMVYKFLVEEHLDAWMKGYFKPEDLSLEELAYHNEYVDFAKKNGMI